MTKCTIGKGDEWPLLTSRQPETRLQLMLRLNAELAIGQERYEKTMKRFDELAADVRHQRAVIEERRAQLAHVARAAEAAGEIRLRYAVTETT